MVKPKHNKKRITIVVLSLFAGICGVACTGIKPKIQHIEPKAVSGTSLATVVKDVPLAFTGQIFPYDENGNPVGASNSKEQLDQVMKNVEKVLASVGSDLEGLVRINLYVNDDLLYEEVLGHIGELLPKGAGPSITCISGVPSREDVMLSMDVVAVAPTHRGKERVRLLRTAGIYGQDNRADVAVLPPGRKVFISGQAEPGDDLVQASNLTMHSLFATLAYLGASAEDVVQIKAFINPMEDAKAVEEGIASFFRGKNAPPIVTVEWMTAANKAEIELVASAPEEPARAETVSYYAPNWMDQATTYSKIVDVARGGLFFTSGLYGEGEKDGETEARSIFATLNRILEQAGSDYDHLVKSTYYPSNEEGRNGLVNVRTSFYNPRRPPAASLIQVQGVGRQGNSLTVDMIGVVPE